ncbi:MAG: mechanosensitive ion channel, partial [Chromatiales bacterium]
MARFLDTVLNEDVFPRIDLPRGVPYAISTLTRYTLIVIGFMVALAAAGIELGKLTIIAGGLGVGIGFGLQTIVSNFVSGLILLFERPLKVGDAITVKSLTGEIRSIGIRASSIRTSDGAEVILPNSQLIAEAVTNWTFRGRRRRIEIQVGVKGGVAAQDIIELLQNVARQHKSILNTPPPNAVLTKYSESSLDFQLQVWIAEFRD